MCDDALTPYRYDVSVIVLTYNSSPEKLLKTLHSVTIQKNIRFEVIISDDGSADDLADMIRSFFQSIGFTDYTLLRSAENSGTVKNFLRGVKTAQGEYVKGISPGDFLYDAEVLKNLYDFSRTRGSKICFSQADFYSMDGNDNRQQIPRHISMYLSGKKNLRAEYFLFDDVPVGAVYFIASNVLLKYLEIVQGRIIYAEDYSVGLMLSDGIDLDYYPGHIIWYESDTGISVRSNDVWRKRLSKDLEEMHKLLVERIDCAENPAFVRFQNTFFRIGRWRSYFMRNAVRSILYPKYALRMLKREKTPVRGNDAKKLADILKYDVGQWCQSINNGKIK